MTTLEKTLTFSLAAALLIAILPAAPAAAAQEERDFGRNAVHRALSWENPHGDGRADGLYLLEMNQDGMVTRVLADPADRPIRLTKTLDARLGVESGELLDDATGWWAVLDLDTGLASESLSAYFAAATQINPGTDHVLRLTLRTSDGLKLSRQLAPAEPAELHTQLAQALVEAGLADRLVASLPDGLADAVLFLDRSLSPDPLPTGDSVDNIAYSTRGVVEVLAAAIRAATDTPESADGPWPMTVGAMDRGLLNADELELVSRFRSVENADPLSDRRPDEVLGKPSS